ncbi:iron complex outermembrane receptor protein [Azospirillum fermentarium]|uniref:TonB-dependent receptor n=1 Tax=Azospirillum fermentarium TaxID=1233114 RepID=UPI00222716F8|nr:TonB-dependent receptor [Azospirillum fermentarium]MCW2246746.1 iron complex outermembrane receptor protein [Azospirillum fermentarium]
MSVRSFKRGLLAVTALIMPAAAVAQTVSLDTITVEGAPEALTATTLGGEALASRRLSTSDTAGLLQSVPGVSLSSGGAISALPALNGLGADRVKTLIDGMSITAACPNFMNPPLSTITPASVGQITVLAGITPVSAGGDSIGGTIAADSPAPPFSQAGQGVTVSGRASTAFRSVNEGVTAAASATVATESVSLGYDGSWSRSNNYRAGGNGARVRSTEAEAINHALTLALRSDNHRVEIKGGVQSIPYQGFPNQRMDLTDNQQGFVNLHYAGSFGWGGLDARAYFQRVNHTMNFLDDKGGTSRGGMPMKTRGTDTGYTLTGTIPLTERDTLRVGNELHSYALDDWWPPVAGAMMMSPLTYINVNDGRRTRLGTFAEVESRWSPAWTTLLGVRNDMVWSRVGTVQPYSWASRIGMMANPDAAAATAFNRGDRSATDANIDATALVRYEPSATATYEAGVARKTRSPNLYERYSWGTGQMASTMSGWYGDANGYIGNPALKPEKAYTASLSGGWHDAGRADWAVTVTPYYTYVQDYIDVDRVQRFSQDFVQLRFANHDAVLFGINASAFKVLARGERWGDLKLSAVAGWVQGRNLDDGGSLYHLMPLNATVTLEHRLGGWNNALELQGAAAKNRVDDTRNEPHTASYALVNLRTGYQWGNVRVDAGIDNLFDARYDLPLGGVSYGDFKAGGSVAGTLRALPAPGRSFNAGLTMTF